MPYAHTKEQAHELINRMGPSQVPAVVGLLKTMLDPLARSLATAKGMQKHQKEEKE